VANWKEKKVKATIATEEDLQKWIEKQALAEGKSLETPFVFRIKGDFDLVGYHIISKDPTVKEHTHELHDLAKKEYSVENTSGELIGFYSRNHEGVFTHKGSFIHIHFIDTAKRQMGHLEELKWKGKGIFMVSE
jgi:acetolactate decarboxylase